MLCKKRYRYRHRHIHTAYTDTNHTHTHTAALTDLQTHAKFGIPPVDPEGAADTEVGARRCRGWQHTAIMYVCMPTRRGEYDGDGMGDGGWGMGDGMGVM